MLTIRFTHSSITIETGSKGYMLMWRPWLELITVNTTGDT